ncbi:hypothetical protein DFH07DRAFT_948022 [Mycena maculata]|uniref:Uncharacterized protein n=1 Tax=Mycena maculata TaxID=230809 RepID=A0AAD7KGW7_9AGAR|nr:hypothetical protein DFH07DRAFT_948022 [Mycena maculata]
MSCNIPASMVDASNPTAEHTEGSSVTDSTIATKAEAQALPQTRPNTPEPENEISQGAHGSLGGGTNQTSLRSATGRVYKPVKVLKSSSSIAEVPAEALASSDKKAPQGKRQRYDPAMNGGFRQQVQQGGRYRGPCDDDDTDTEEERATDPVDDRDKADTDIDEAEAETILTAAAGAKRAVRFTPSTKAVHGEGLKNHVRPVQRGFPTSTQKTNRETLKMVNSGSSSSPAPARAQSTSASTFVGHVIPPFPTPSGEVTSCFFPVGGDMTLEQLAALSNASRGPCTLKRARENDDGGGDEQRPAQRRCYLHDFRDYPGLMYLPTFRVVTK